MNKVGIALLSFVIVGIAILALGVYWLRTPIRDARSVRIGDDIAVVTELLGAPTSEFRSDSELQSSELRAMSFVFDDVNDESVSSVSVPDLPAIEVRAVWFEYAPTAGHLVYFDENGAVARVLWGGT